MTWVFLGGILDKVGRKCLKKMHSRTCLLLRVQLSITGSPAALCGIFIAFWFYKAVV